MKKKHIFIALGALGIVGAMALALHLEGRIPICECGYVKFWHNAVNDSGNSQHLFDWYSFSHFLHGLLIYLLLWLVDRKKRLSFTAKFLIAIGIEAGWELLENSSFIINRYRSATISLDYFGDSIINSIGDVIAMTAGFLFASKTKAWISIAAFIAIELILLYAIRDNLTLNVIMLIHPIEAIKTWQSQM